MKKIILIALLVVITFKSFSQRKLWDDSIKIDQSSILIATSSGNKDYEFCIDKPKDFVPILKNLNYGPQQDAAFEKNPVVVKLVSKGLITQIWSVRPKSSVIEINNKKFSFDAAEILKLARKYPIKYIIQEKVFDDQLQLSTYYSNLLKDKKFLYMVPPDFDNQWQGKFFLSFDRNDTLNSPLAISNYLQPKFELIENKNKFSIAYQPFDVGKNDGKSRITMTVFGTKKLYEQFSDKLLTKAEWQPQPYLAYIIMRP